MITAKTHQEDGMINYELDGKVAVITGGASGLSCIALVTTLSDYVLDTHQAMSSRRKWPFAARPEGSCAIDW